jgi:hypothetical protein
LRRDLLEYRRAAARCSCGVLLDPRCCRTPDAWRGRCDTLDSPVVSVVVSVVVSAVVSVAVSVVPPLPSLPVLL